MLRAIKDDIRDMRHIHSTGLASRVDALFVEVDALYDKFSDPNIFAYFYNATLNGDPDDKIYPMVSTSNKQIYGFPETFKDLDTLTNSEVNRILHALGVRPEGKMVLRRMQLRRTIQGH